MKIFICFILLVLPGSLIAGEPIDTPRSDLRVSLGRISQTKSGYLTVVGPKERAVRTSGEHSNAVLQFRYRGPSETISLLDSGSFVRQIGLKMRAMNTCNLLYVMWRIKPTEEIYIAIKRNPGKSKYKECLSRGYLQLGRVPLKPLGITAATQKAHRLGASVTETDGRYTCAVTIDGRRVGRGKARGSQSAAEQAAPRRMALVGGGTRACGAGTDADSANGKRFAQRPGACLGTDRVLAGHLADVTSRSGVHGQRDRRLRQFGRPESSHSRRTDARGRYE